MTDQRAAIDGFTRAVNERALAAQHRAEQPIRDMPTWTTFFGHLRGEQQWRQFIVHHGPNGQTWLAETQYAPAALNLDTIAHITPPGTTPDDLAASVLEALHAADAEFEITRDVHEFVRAVRSILDDTKAGT